MRKILRPFYAFAAFAGLTMAMAVSAYAESTGTPSAASDPVFGSRTEKADGSVAMSVGRRLPTDWDSKVGTDVNLSGPTGETASDTLLRGPASDRSTGSIWGTLAVPSPAPQIWDKATVDARVDAAQDNARLSATLSRSVPLGQDVSVELRNSYSVSKPLPDQQPATTSQATGPAPAMLTDWATDQSVRLNIAPSGTALSAGGVSTSADEPWHSKLSLEQTLFGPLKVTTSVEAAGTPASKKSITAGFKQVW